MMGKGAISAFAAIALAVGLTPLPAFASEGLTAADVAQQTAVETQASAKTVIRYAVVGVKDTTQGEINGKSYTNKLEFTYTYKNGLLATSCSPSYALKYSGAKLKSVGTSKLKYDKKNRVVAWRSNPYHSYDAYKYNKKNQVIRDDDNTSYAYDKDNRVTTSTYSKSGSQSSASDSPQRKKTVTDKYTYDKSGNVKKSTSTSSVQCDRGSGWEKPTTGKMTAKYTNRYNKSKRLTGRKGTFSDGRTESITYTYKKVSVPKKYVAQFEAQQWAIHNWNLNFAFPSYGILVGGSMSDDSAGPWASNAWL